MSDAVAMWSAALLAALLAGWRLAALLRADINVAAATALLVKLAGAGNLDRARKLCRAAPRSPYFIALAAALAGDGASREVRRARFDDAFGPALARIERRGWMDLVSLLAAAVAILIAATSPGPALAVAGLSAGAGLVALRNRRAMRRMRRQPLIAVPTVLDAIAVPTTPAAAASAPTVPPPPDGSELPPADDGGPGVLHLTASVDGENIASLALEREVVKVGKLASSHLQLDHPSVNRMHAVIETTSEGSTIIDLGSTSGTRINGERINKATIADGDEIRIGDVLIRVTTGPGAPVVSKPAPPPPPSPPPGGLLDLRNGTCPLCRARTIARRPAVAGDLVPWVCEGCGYAQLFTAG